VDVILRCRVQLPWRDSGSRITTLKSQLASRILQPELLDELPANDPPAIASRRDLQRLNRWLGHLSFVESAVRDSFASGTPSTIVEIGCGDGTFALELVRRLNAVNPGKIFLVDRQAIVTRATLDKFEHLGWKADFVNADIFEWLPTQPATDCVIANLFLHHFESSRIRTLFESVSQRTKVFIACEPRRHWRALIGSYLLSYATCTSVTRHDAPISVRAGFRGGELSELWPRGNWDLQENSAGVGAHLFIARKRV
jgi:SAM-dependent methyltransferase